MITEVIFEIFHFFSTSVSLSLLRTPLPEVCRRRLRMSDKLFRMGYCIKLKLTHPHLSLVSLHSINLLPLDRTLKPLHFINSSPFCSTSSSLCSSTLSESFDYLTQFSPFGHAKLGSLNSNERRKIFVGLSKLIKDSNGFLLKAFSLRFCPFYLVRIMKELETRETAFAFFKFTFGNCSQETVESCCLAAHILAANDLRLHAQDVVSYVFGRIGATRSRELVEYMWKIHHEYESDFSVLDTVMRGFLNVEMGYEALHVLNRMREIGVRPSLSTVSILFRLLLRVGDYGSVWKLFRDMVRKGPVPSNITLNGMIYGFCRLGWLNIGESLLHVMHRYRCIPDALSYNILINAYCIRGNTSVALDWLHFMIVRGCNPSIATFSTVVNALCKEGNVLEARKIFDGIKDFGVSPNTIIYNTMINGYVKARDICQANMLYEDMLRNGISPDGVTFNILLSGNSRYGNKEDGNKYLRDLYTSELLPLCSIYDISVSGLCWAGKVDEAKQLLLNVLEKGLSHSVVAFNSIIAAYSREGFEQKAFEAYNLISKYGFTPSSSSCSSLLMCLCQKDRVLEARTILHKMMEKGYQINKVAYTILLDGYFKTGDLDGAHALWNEMKVGGGFPDAVAYSAFIDGLSKAGLLQEAYNVFLEMSGRGFTPNNYAYNSLIGGFCNCGQLIEALELEKEMRQKGLVPDVFTTNILINGFCKKGRMKSAVDKFLDMHRRGLTPDIVTYNTLIGGYCEAYDMVSADDIVYRMYICGWNPDVITYNTRIHGYCRRRKINRAVMILDELVSAGIIPDTITYNIMMTAACSDILDRAMILTAKLLKLAFVPNVATVNMLLSQYCKHEMPDKTLMWAQKLSDVAFDFNEISYKIMNRAYRLIQENGEHASVTTRKSLFLDFLMYITYDYLSRNRYSEVVSQQSSELIEIGFAKP